MESDLTTWQEGLNLKQKYQPLSKNINVDVLIIGAGITGITSAYLLSMEKLKVAMIDESVIGQNCATAYTTAMISYETDTDLSVLADTIGRKNAKLCWEAGRDALNFIERTVKSEKISCEFAKCSGYSYTFAEKDLDEMEDDVELSNNFGFDVKIGDKKLGFAVAGYEEFSNQAKFHPLKYIVKLSRIAHDGGVEIYENTKALKVIEDENGITVPCDKAAIYAKHVILATYSPFTHPLSMYFKAGQYTTYVIEAKIKKGKIPEGIFEDWDSPYHYFRIDTQDSHDRIIIGGEDHRSDLPVSPKKSFAALEKYLEKITGGDYKIIKRWTGPILEPIDGLPYIGKLNKKSHQYVTHGFSGTGMTFGTLSALIFRDLITGEENQYAKLFDPTRLPAISKLITKGRDYTEELMGAAFKNTFIQK